jgi:hypothetical protein
LEGLEEILSRRPELGMAIPDCDPSRFASWPLHLDTVTIRVFYCFNAEDVFLLDVMAVPSE